MTEGVMDRRIGIGPIEQEQSVEEFNRQADIDLSAKKLQWEKGLIGSPSTKSLNSEVNILRQALKNQEEFFLNLLEIDRKKLRVQEITIGLLSGPLKDLAKVSGEVNAFGGANLSRSDSERVVLARRDAIDALRACGFQVSTVQELVDKEWLEGPEFKLSDDEAAMLKRAMARAGQ